jgi:hypothetical protein
MKIVENTSPLPNFKAVITPARDNDWDTGRDIVVVDIRNSTIVPHKRFHMRSLVQPGRPISEAWADVIVAGSRLRIPIEFSDVTRKRRKSCKKSRVSF